MQDILTVRWIFGSTYLILSFLRVYPLTDIIQERNLYYVVQVEVFLAKVFSNFNSGEEEEETLLVAQLTLFRPS